MEWLKIILISMFPFSELRGAIPYAALMDVNPLEAYILSVLGNFLPIPLILFILHKAEPLIERIPIVGDVYKFFVKRAEKKKEIVERYGYFGLTLFVAVPLPVTGAWTGSLIAFLMGLDKRKSMAFIFVGILIAGLIVLSASYGILGIMKMLPSWFNTSTSIP